MEDQLTRELGSMPPAPKDQEMLKNIEVLALFVSRNGPQFEDMAKVRQAKNPKFSFLFDSLPGTEAAIAREYFLWKKKFLQMEKQKEEILPGTPSKLEGDNEGQLSGFKDNPGECHLMQRSQNPALLKDQAGNDADLLVSESDDPIISKVGWEDDVEGQISGLKGNPGECHSMRHSQTTVIASFGKQDSKDLSGSGSQQEGNQMRELQSGSEEKVGWMEECIGGGQNDSGNQKKKRRSGWDDDVNEPKTQDHFNYRDGQGIHLGGEHTSGWDKDESKMREPSSNSEDRGSQHGSRKDSWREEHISGWNDGGNQKKEQFSKRNDQETQPREPKHEWDNERSQRREHRSGWNGNELKGHERSSNWDDQGSLPREHRSGRDGKESQLREPRSGWDDGGNQRSERWSGGWADKSGPARERRSGWDEKPTMDKVVQDNKAEDFMPQGNPTALTSDRITNPTEQISTDRNPSETSFRTEATESSHGQPVATTRLGRLDEFGRTVQENSSGSDSDSGRRRSKRSRRSYNRSYSRSSSQSRSRSRSPGGFKRRRSISRSPPRRGRWSRSRSRSPRWSQSRSPPRDGRWRGRGRGEWDFQGRGRRGRGGPSQPPQPCFDFTRGRCYRGSSCRFIHQRNPSGDDRWASRGRGWRDSGPDYHRDNYEPGRRRSPSASFEPMDSTSKGWDAPTEDRGRFEPKSVPSKERSDGPGADQFVGKGAINQPKEETVVLEKPAAVQGDRLGKEVEQRDTGHSDRIIDLASNADRDRNQSLDLEPSSMELEIPSMSPRRPAMPLGQPPPQPPPPQVGHPFQAQNLNYPSQPRTPARQPVPQPLPPPNSIMMPPLRPIMMMPFQPPPPLVGGGHPHPPPGNLAPPHPSQSFPLVNPANPGLMMVRPTSQRESFAVPDKPSQTEPWNHTQPPPLQSSAPASTFYASGNQQMGFAASLQQQHNGYNLFASHQPNFSAVGQPVPVRLTSADAPMQMNSPTPSMQGGGQTMSFNRPPPPLPPPSSVQTTSQVGIPLYIPNSGATMQSTPRPQMEQSPIIPSAFNLAVLSSAPLNQIQQGLQISLDRAAAVTQEQGFDRGIPNKPAFIAPAVNVSISGHSVSTPVISPTPETKQKPFATFNSPEKSVLKTETLELKQESSSSLVTPVIESKVFKPPPVFISSVVPLQSTTEAGITPTNVVTTHEPSVSKAELSSIDGADKDEGGDDVGQTKQMQDVKLLKSAVADYVKEVLKPAWREGQISKEAFKTIAKKAVDKVAGVLQGNQIPGTQEQLDHFMLTSRTKIAKLVKGYVEKYTKA